MIFWLRSCEVWQEKCVTGTRTIRTNNIIAYREDWVSGLRRYIKIWLLNRFMSNISNSVHNIRRERLSHSWWPKIRFEVVKHLVKIIVLCMKQWHDQRGFWRLTKIKAVIVSLVHPLIHSLNNIKTPWKQIQRKHNFLSEIQIENLTSW